MLGVVRTRRSSASMNIIECLFWSKWVLVALWWFDSFATNIYEIVLIILPFLFCVNQTMLRQCPEFRKKKSYKIYKLLTCRFCIIILCFSPDFSVGRGLWISTPIFFKINLLYLCPKFLLRISPKFQIVQFGFVWHFCGYNYFMFIITYYSLYFQIFIYQSFRLVQGESYIYI